MSPTVHRLLLLAVLGLAPSWGAGCLGAVATFDPSTGVLSVPGTDGPDTLVVSVNGHGFIVVNGGQLAISGGIPTVSNTVRIEITGLGGDDHLALDESAGPLPGALIAGGLGVDFLVGGSGGDTIVGGDGDDVAYLGGGDDRFVWSAGDDLDTVEGQGGFDTLLFNGNGASESIDVSAIGGRVRLFRNVATVTMDLDDVESIDFPAQGGADVVVVNDVAGTDLVELNVDLAAAAGGGDAQPDTVIVNATGGDDVALVVGDASGVSVLGLAAQVNVAGAESALDRLTLNALAGDDVVEATGLAASGIALTADGGADDDVLIGGDGSDVFLGGEGDDVLLGGPGIDVLDGGLGTNVVIQD